MEKYSDGFMFESSHFRPKTYHFHRIDSFCNNAEKWYRFVSSSELACSCVSMEKSSIPTITISLTITCHISFAQRRHIYLTVYSIAWIVNWYRTVKMNELHTDVGRLNLLQFQFYPIHWFFLSFYRDIDFWCWRNKCFILFAINLISRRTQLLWYSSSFVCLSFNVSFCTLALDLNVWIHETIIIHMPEIVQVKAFLLIRWSKC